MKKNDDEVSWAQAAVWITLFLCLAYSCTHHP